MSRTYKKSFEYHAFDICKTSPAVSFLYKKITSKKLRHDKNMSLQNGSYYKKIGKYTGAKKFDDCEIVQKKLVNPIKRNYFKKRSEAKKYKIKTLIKVASLEFKEIC